jgi:hypothetical protein
VACSCPQNKVLIDDFESCTGTCGWAVSGGTASVVSTILPGEHGLRMDGGATAVKTIPFVSIDTSYSLQLVGDCPAGLTASLAGTVAGAPDVTLMVTLAIDTSLDSSGNPPDYSGASYVPLVGTITFPMGVMTAGIHQITLQPAAGTSCTVDVVRLTSVTPCNN